MKKLLSLGMVMLSCLVSSSTASAASCKPDREWVDSISKQRNFLWQHNLTEIGFWKSMVATDIELWALVLRWGNYNAINLQLTKIENDRDRAALDSRFRATKGDRFILGLKNGEPLSFVAAEVENQSKIVEGKGLVMTVILSAVVPDKDMALFRDALTKKQIEAVRVFLASGMVDRAINDENGEAMMEKFSCFYQYLDKSGISLTAGGDSEKLAESATAEKDVAAVRGKYLRKGKSNDFLELGNGTFSLSQDGHSLEGTYTVQGDILVLTSPRMRVPAKAHLIGHTIEDDEGIIWEKQDEAVKSPAQLTIDQIIQMVAVKLADDIIITTIQNSHSKFDLTPEILIKLKTGGVSDAVIRAMAR